jgi:tetratricopeptide (TPR) repeat protein
VASPTGCRAAALLAAAALLTTACASGRVSNRFIRHSGKGGIIELAEDPAVKAPAVSEAAVQAAVSKAVRERGRGNRAALPTAETSDEGLRAALLAAGSRPTADAHISIAAAYARLRVFDLAMEHFDRALEQNPRSAAAYDGRARIWRDWKIPGYAVGDAHRAVYLAPRSAAARNTLGTVLMLVGACRGAEAAYERALALDPSADWAASNLDQVKAMRRAGSPACRDIAADHGEAAGATR